MAVVPGHYTGTITAETKPLLWIAVCCACVIALPILSLFSYLLIPTGEIRAHLLETVFASYFLNSIVLIIGTAIGTFIIGVSTAWLCSVCNFPGKRFYEWGLILPLAYPAYIVAYTYTGMLDYNGSIYIWLQNVTGITTPIPIRSLSGAIAIITLALYPYVYLLARSAWLQRSNRLLESGCILGAGPWGNFWRIALPAARPAIAAGIAIVVMETLADYGTVQYFGVNTFSVGIFRTWFGLNSIGGAAQLSLILLAFTIAVMLAEKSARKRARYHTITHHSKPYYHLHGKSAFAANVICALPIIAGFIMPTVQLSAWTVERINTTTLNDHLSLVVNTVSVALVAAIAITVIALLLAYVKRLYPIRKSKPLIAIASSGYAIPGIVIAVGVLTLAGFVQNLTQVFVSGSIAVLLLAYCTRFLTLGVNTLDATMEKISPNINFAARILNAAPGTALMKIYLPLVKSGLFTALLLVFVDIVKELPMTLVLRPFNFNTLAVRTYELAADERLADAALPALTIVIISLPAIMILVKSMRTKT